MSDVVNLRWDEVIQRARRVAKEIRAITNQKTDGLLVYAVPNGGIPAALAVLAAEPGLRLVEEVERANLIIDDLVDSGKTRNDHAHLQIPFLVLLDKQLEGLMGQWVSFPWERMSKDNDGIEDNIRRVLQFIGEDPNREGLKETPARVARSYQEIYAGYKQNPEEVLKIFEDDSCDEMVILKGIEFTSNCEHHMLPFVGQAHIAYIPDGKVIGISKLARVLGIFSRRLQIQERMTEQITQALMEHLKPKGAACVLEASHLCMSCRGVSKQHSRMVTSSLLGVFRQPEVRSEFFSMIRNGS